MNFEKYIGYPITSQSLPYDIHSIMHFDETMFSMNGKPTLLARQSIELKGAENKDKLTKIDVEKVRRLYKCFW